jgi:hypothetical protein
MLPDIAVWLAHFEHHAARTCQLSHERPERLTGPERVAIARSIATFQRGEQGEGAHLLAAAAELARSQAVPEIVPIMRLLIREEQRHAALLRAFMDRYGIPVRQRDWSDRIFRRLRHLAGFELCVSVLITAELIGIVYYRALEAATRCQPLRTLCRTLVADELAHVAFEAELLLALRARRAVLPRLLLRWAHRALFILTVVVVWHTHRSVLHRAGHRLRDFLALCQAQYSFYLEAPVAAPASIAAR